MRDHTIDVLLEPLVHPGADPEDVAQTVLEQLSGHQRDQLLRDLLLTRARRAVAARTPRAPRMVMADPHPAPAPVPHTPAPKVLPIPVQHSPSSAKVAGIRNWWQDFLSEQVLLGTSTKRVADCTAADLDVLARQTMAAAQRTAKKAHGLAALAGIMREDGARTVKDISQVRAQRVLSK